jgi:GTP cyclohydrolase IA
METTDLTEHTRSCKGMTYEERFGAKKGSKLRQLRSRSAIEQMKDPSQRALRRESARYKRTKENKQKLSKIKTIHGGTTYRKRALDYYGNKCSRCGFKPKSASKLHVHHKDGMNISSELADHSVENLRVLCRKCHRKLHNELSKMSAKFYGIHAIEKGVHFIFKGLKQAYNLDLRDENFKETPGRVARAYAEIFEGVENTDQQVNEILASGFPCTNSQMVVVKGIRTFSMCPHHLLPVDYTVVVAYLPSVKRKGKVLGISKLARLVQVLSRRPVLQEQLVRDVTDALMRLPGCLGAGCLAKGKHYCMIMRGVNQPDTYTITSSLQGKFLTRPVVRSEFLSLAKKSVVE